ncbi:hypothetical protein F4804DRAFT_325268 [Jackrogersella minutella]|nr:hypothetical protein F4804DRAFT_325268 [Jackrogersella minutella]
MRIPLLKSKINPSKDLTPSRQILPTMIPGGMTSLLQVLDTHLNKVVKQLLRDFHDLWIQNREDEYKVKGIEPPPLTTGDQRIKTTIRYCQSGH